MTDWPELREDFRRVVAMRRRAGCTMEEIASSIPCSRDTVYDLLGGVVQKPAPATVVCVRNFVRKASASRQPEPDPSVADSSS